MKEHWTALAPRQRWELQPWAARGRACCCPWRAERRQLVLVPAFQQVPVPTAIHVVSATAAAILMLSRSKRPPAPVMQHCDRMSLSMAEAPWMEPPGLGARPPTNKRCWDAVLGRTRMLA